jgi:hypothetical protein
LRTPPPHNPAGLFRSQYAVASTEGELGTYGAVLLKPWTPRSGGWRVGERLDPGTVIPAEVALKWPIHNRLAMKENRFVRFFLSAEEAAEAAAGNTGQPQPEPDARQRRLEILEKARQVRAEKRQAAASEV